jgi:OOP family OmpA-OmpF porin
MKSKKALVAALIGVSAAVAAPAAFAQARSQPDAGWYAGGSLGQSEAQGSCPSGFSCDLKDTAFKVFGGYRINRNFAAEAFWGEWGEISVSLGGATANVESRTIGVAGLGILPIGQQFELFGKLGIGNTKLKATGSGLATGLTSSDSGSDVLFGFGAAYNFTRNLGVRAEWERLNDSEIDIMSIGLQYRF